MHYANAPDTSRRMSEFGNFIAAQTKAQKITGRDLAARMGIDSTHFSQFLNGRRVSCNVETLMKMALGVSSDDAVRAGLLEAYFRDQCLDRFKTWVSVDPQREGAASVLREAAPEPPYTPPIVLQRTVAELRLSYKVVEALIAIARAVPGRHKFRAVVEDLGRFAQTDLLDREDHGDEEA